MNMLKSSSAIVLASALFSATPALALKATTDLNVQANVGNVGASVTASANVDAKVSAAKDKADQEIQRRMDALNDLNTKVQAMVHVSATEKASVSSMVQSEISTLATLKVKIDADTDLATLKTDIKSIAPDYRIFMLIIPQGRIEVAADRLQTIGTAYTTFAGKLQARISAGQAAGKDVTAATTALTDMNAKIADVSVQAQAAVSHVSTLTPDNGDKTMMASNQDAIKKARADIQVALSDIKAARKDAGTIVQTIQSWHLDTSASSTVSTQTQTTQ